MQDRQNHVDRARRPLFLNSTYVRPRRALDWWCTIVMLGVGVTLAIPGNSIRYFGLESLLTVMPQPAWAGAALFVAGTRVAALAINGRLYEGAPAVRAVAALFGAVLWAEFAYASYDHTASLSIFSPGVWMTACLALADVHNVMRAAIEIVHARRARHDPD